MAGLNHDNIEPQCQTIFERMLPSQIPQHPLSLKELRDIRALIGVAKGKDGPTPKKSTEDGKHHLSSCEPLAGRRVIVPFASKAFFEGILDPPNKMIGFPLEIERGASGDATAKTEIAFEEIIAYIGAGYLVEMTRAGASAVFGKLLHQNPYAKSKIVNGKITVSTPNKHPPQSKNKAIVDEKKSTTNSSTSIETNLKRQTRDYSENFLPFMEIREECDSRGNLVRSEVINMSNEMQRLDEQFSNTTIDGEDNDGKKFGKLLAQTLKGKGIIASHIQPTCGAGFGTRSDGAEDLSNDAESMQSNTSISDDAYQALRLRLEELERLEEKDIQSKKENAKSSKQSQSSGWSKGFLNTSKKKKAKKTSSVNVKKDNATVVKIDPSPRINGNSAEIAATETLPTSSKPISDDTTEKDSKVSFSGKNDVKEIPRIGQLKVPQRPNSMASKADSQHTLPFNPFPPAPTIPFEENVFSGVVKERTSSATKSSSERSKESIVAESGGKDGAGKKRLSRFAQQRQHQGC